MPTRCARGATTVPENTKTEILNKTAELLTEMINRNGIAAGDIVSVLFTATGDLDAAYPAEAARGLGISDAGLCCYQEMRVEGSLPKCVRVLMNVESEREQRGMEHVYLRGAAGLRPDLNGAGKRRCAIAIDGPSGSGKSTAARRVANGLGFIYADTGAMYRAVALYCIENGIDLSGGNIPPLDKIDITLKYENGRQRIFLNGRDVTGDIRTQRVADGSSRAAAIKEVREKLVEIQRGLAGLNSVVMDGRDIGTHVLPGAQLKIYLDADKAVRAKRRAGELSSDGRGADYERVLAEITERDKRDVSRENSPLKIAGDAVYLDTGEMSEEEVAAKIIDLFGRRADAI